MASVGTEHGLDAAPNRPRPGQRIRAFYARNGLYLTVHHAVDILGAHLRSRLVASSLGSPQGFSIGADSRILGASQIRVGRRFIGGRQLWLEVVQADRTTRPQPAIVIGDNVTVGDFVRIAANLRVSIGNDVLMGSRIYISDHNHGDYRGAVQSDPTTSPRARPLSKGREVVIGDRVWIGEGAVVLPGSRVGEGSVVGANAVVSGDVPASSIVVGNPARLLKRYDSSRRVWDLQGRT